MNESGDINSSKCPVKRLKKYNSFLEVFMDGMVLIMRTSLRLSLHDSQIYTRRSFQRTFLAGWNDFLKTYHPEIDKVYEPLESGLSEFWKDILTRAERIETITRLNNEIGFLQHSQTEYHKQARSGKLGNIKKITSNVLELTQSIPEMHDEMHFIINTFLIVKIGLALYLQKSESQSLDQISKRITLEIIQSLLINQKADFNNQTLAFITSTCHDALTGKDIFPVEFFEEENTLRWKLSEGFEKKLNEIRGENIHRNHAYTQMITGCPAATDGIIGNLLQRVYVILQKD